MKTKNKKDGENIEIGKAEIIEGKINLKKYYGEIEAEVGRTISFILPWEYYETGGEKSEWHFFFKLLDYRGNLIGSIYEIKKDSYARPDRDDGKLKLSFRAPGREGMYKYHCRIGCKLAKAKKWDKNFTPEKNRVEVGKKINPKRDEVKPVMEKKESFEVRLVTRK